MHKSYRVEKNLGNQTQIFGRITETQSQPIQGSPLSPWVFLSLEVTSGGWGGRREAHDSQRHQCVHASSRKSSALPALRCRSSQVTDEIALVPDGMLSLCPPVFSVPFMPCLKGWDWFCCSPAKLEPWNCGRVICGQMCFDATHSAFSLGLPLPSLPEARLLAEIITWETQGMACSWDLRLPPLSSLPLHPPSLSTTPEKLSLN